MRSVYLLVIFLLIIFINAPTFVSAEDETSASDQYKIGASDILNIFVWREAELTQDITVMSDGRITFPMIGEIMAKGLTVTELKEIITGKLKDYVSTPEVTVIVRESRSRRIYTIGQLNQPGPYQLEPEMTVLQALATAGGFTEWADKKYVMIVRRDGDKEVMYRFNYQEFISGKNLDQNIILEPNDTIIVP